MKLKDVHSECQHCANLKAWNPETDACDYCKECDYFLNDYWNCQGELEPCWEFIPKRDSKYKKVEIEIISREDKYDSKSIYNKQ